MAEMNPADVPAELVECFAAAIEQHVATVGPRVIPYREIAPIVLAAVLPLIQQQTRAGVVEELKAHAADCYAHARRCDDADDDERSAALITEAEHFAGAAQYITADPEGGDDA